MGAGAQGGCAVSTLVTLKTQHQQPDQIRPCFEAAGWTRRPPEVPSDLSYSMFLHTSEWQGHPFAYEG